MLKRVHTDGSVCASVTPIGLSVEGAVGLDHGGFMEGYGQVPTLGNIFYPLSLLARLVSLDIL